MENRLKEKREKIYRLLGAEQEGRVLWESGLSESPRFLSEIFRKVSLCAFGKEIKEQVKKPVLR